jgi:hypothetical protein
VTEPDATTSTAGGDRPAATDRYLATYLRDHRAGAELGLRLARRCRDHASEDQMRADLGQLVNDIDADRGSLDDLMTQMSVAPSRLKQVVGVATERIARLKPNGRLFQRSPISLLLELEALAAGISTKRNLWRALHASTSARGQDTAHLEHLEERADDQLGRVLAWHAREARRSLEVPEHHAATAPLRR